MKKLLVRTDLMLAALVIVLAVGVFLEGQRMWWFTPASSQRHTVQAFFSDLSTNNTAAAYKLTSTTFQTDNSYTSFQQDVSSLTNQKSKISYSNYLAKDSKVTVSGKFTFSKVPLSTNFGFNVVPQSGKYSIDSFVFF